MKGIELNKESKIKRRNFFFYTGAVILGVYSLSKLPFKIFKSKVTRQASLTVLENPEAVRRGFKKV
jgi:hypothetical protein